MSDITNIFPYDAFAKYLGIELVDVSAGVATARMEVEERHLNSYGTVHGGALFALADAVFAVASNSHGRVAVAIDAHVSYVKAVHVGTLTAVAEEVSRSRVLATYEVRIFDGADELVARFNGTVYRKKQHADDVL